MKTPQVAPMAGMSPLGLNRHDRAVAKRIEDYFNPHNVDEKTVAERKWQQRKLAPAPQKPCDVGLFSDDSKQSELF